MKKIKKLIATFMFCVSALSLWFLPASAAFEGQYMEFEQNSKEMVVTISGEKIFESIWSMSGKNTIQIYCSFSAK